MRYYDACRCCYDVDYGDIFSLLRLLQSRRLFSSLATPLLLRRKVHSSGRRFRALMPLLFYALWRVDDYCRHYDAFAALLFIFHGAAYQLDA